MNQASPPDANRLVYRIRTAITGESMGLETAKLAWQYAEAIDRANAQLAKANDSVTNKRLLDAVLIEHKFPRLLEASRELDFGVQTEIWIDRCRRFTWREPGQVDKAAADSLASAFGDISDTKDWLFKEYRNAVRAKNDTDAFQVISVLSAKHPEDVNAREELDRLQAKLLDKVEAEIRNSLEELIPGEKPQEILERYAAIGLPLEKSSSKLISDALAANASQVASSVTRSVKELLEDSKNLSAHANWREMEKAYLSVEYSVAVNNHRGVIDPETRNAFEQLGTDLSRIRNSYEAEIAIRQAINTLKASLSGKPAATSASGSKPSTPQQCLEKLRSLEKQAVRTSGQISPELQAEIKLAYQLARKKKLPILVGIVGTIAAILVIGIFLVKGQVESNAAKQAEADALAALQQAEKQGSVSIIENALVAVSPAIKKSEGNSNLSGQAEMLANWVETQKKLESEYAAKTEQFATLVESANPLADQQKIDDAIASLASTRSGLAIDRGETEDARIATLRSQWQSSVARANRQNNQQVTKLIQEISIAVQNAVESNTRAEFDRLTNAANTRMIALEQLLNEGRAQTQEKQSKELIANCRSQLNELEDKWIALDSARTQVAQAKDLASYIDAITRIHSFDILSATEKSSIEQSLRLQSALTALKSRITLPDNIEAWQEFASGSDYVTSAMTLDEEEKAFVNRLEGLNIFKNVYTSTVQYYEGNAEAQSEYNILLVEPISKIDPDGVESDVHFSFRIRGFDEFGNQEAKPRNVQLISRDDGSFWGFFYKPSELSLESKYFQDRLQSAFKQLKAGTSRLIVLELIDDLEKQSDLALAFRAYWQSKLIEFMSLHPWKWGFALSPTLQDKSDNIDALFPNGISENLWLSTLEQTVPSPELTLFFDSAESELAIQEVKAFAELYKNGLDGETALAGHVLADGKPFIESSIKAGETLWTVNTLTGRIEKMDEQTGLAPYAPILHYAFADGDKEALIKRTEFSTGFEFGDEKYSELLPPIFD